MFAESKLAKVHRRRSDVDGAPFQDSSRQTAGYFLVGLGSSVPIQS